MDALDRDEVRAKLTDVFKKTFGIPDIQLEDAVTAADVPNWDSLNQIKLILACEKAFGIRLKARDINGLSNVGEMIDHIIRAQNRR